MTTLAAVSATKINKIKAWAPSARVLSCRVSDFGKLLVDVLVKRPGHVGPLLPGSLYKVLTADRHPVLFKKLV